jgi:hypothetical protein
LPRASANLPDGDRESVDSMNPGSIAGITSLARARGNPPIEARRALDRRPRPQCRSPRLLIAHQPRRERRHYQRKPQEKHIDADKQPNRPVG